MSDKDEQNKEHSKISMRIGDVQVEFEGTSEDIKKLMDKQLFDLAKKMEASASQMPPSNESVQKATPKTLEATPKEKTAPPPSKPSTIPEKPATKPNLKMEKTTGKPKKGTNWKNMSLALLMVCIVLLASVVGILAFYLPTIDSLNTQVAEKDASIADLTANVTSLSSQVSSLQATVNQYSNTIKSLNDTASYLNSLSEYYFGLLYMNASEYLFTQRDFTMNANESITVYQGVLEYAGYASVTVQSSSNTTYVQLFYSYKGWNYDQNFTLGESGTAYFPVLPAGVTINIGNTDISTSDSVNGTATAFYYY
jgi:uncharacterized coiled-coil protein SlyX